MASDLDALMEDASRALVEMRYLDAESLLRRVHDLAERDQVSVDQFVATALAEKLSAMLTEDYLQQRAERGNRQRFEAALSLIPDVEPNEDQDRR